MTDLEKLAQEWLERYWGFKMKPGVGKRDLLPLLERVRAAGRIEGLKEAMRNVCIMCREGKAISVDHFHPMIMAAGQIHYELCQASRIHAIVRELEGNK